MTPIATVHVVLDNQTEPGVIKVLLDLLEASAVGSNWSVPPDTDGALLDRLVFGMHEATITTREHEPAEISTDPDAWLHEVQIEIGSALQHGRNWELRIDTAMLGRRAGMSAASEALDLVAGLVRAGRLRTAGPH